MSVSGIVRPRFLYSGVGSTLQFPLDHSPILPSEPPVASTDLEGRLQDAYFVVPASHIGRVVTGVVFVAEQSRVSRVFAEGAGATDRFGLTTISFADKLAEQGYKVLVLDLFQEGKTPTESTEEQVAIVQQAALYLKQKHDIQRVGLCGVGAGADLGIKVSMERSAALDCIVAMCPKGQLAWKPVDSTDVVDVSQVMPPIIPLLLQLGEKSPYAASEAYQTLLSSCAANPLAATALKASLFVNQQSGFAFSNITDEDSATQAIAEILDWLVQHLHRFQVAAATSDTDPWWPQGRNGPFLNVGLRTWQESRATWITATQPRPPRPPPVPAHLLFDGLSSVRRTFDLPQQVHTESPSDGKLAGDDGALEATSLEALENDFQEVLAELEGDKSLERFRLEYEKLHRALKKSNGQEKKLIKKCRELNAEIINNAAKVQTALKLSQEDQASIASLKKEMEKAWKMVDASHEKELRAKETIQQLKEEIVNLGRLVEQGTGLSAGQESMLKEVVRAKEELMRANEEHELNAKKDHERIQELHRRLSDMDSLTTIQKSDIQTLKDQLSMKAAEQEREMRRKERLDKEIKDIKNKLEKKTTEQTQGATELTRLQTHMGALEKQLTESRGTMDKYVRDYETLFGRTQKLTDLLNEQNDKTMQLEVERRNLENELKSRQDEVHRVKLEKGTVERKLDKEKRVIQQLEEKLEGEHTAKLVLQTQIKSMQHDLDLDKINEDHQRTELDALEREKAMQIKQALKAEGKVRRAQDEIKTNERVAKNLEQELAGFKQEAAKQRKLIYQLEKEREKYGMEAAEQRKLYLQAEEEAKLKEMRNHDLQKKVHEGETKLKQQQQLYEAVRSERNLYSKNLIESQDEIAEMKRKFKILTHQIEQLKEEVAAKDVALVKEHFDHQKVEKQKEQHKSELARLRALLGANEETINNQDAEVRKLSTLIRRMDDEALEQRKEYDQVINERDILGTQLIRRNDELALLYEKLKIQQSTLSKGEAQYQERLQDIRVLKLKVTDLKRELYIAKHQVGQADELKREVYHLQRELLQEKTKVKALSEELENPMNVHRWRKLEGSDPATYELLQKIQTLQKRLIQKTEEVVEKELVNQEKEKLYQELKAILARQPGPEVAEQLSWYQQVVREKEKQLKSLLSEQNMFQAKEHELKFEIERLARELHDFKRKYYKKKLEAKMKDKQPVIISRNQQQSQQTQLPNLPNNNSNKSAGRPSVAEAQRQLAMAAANRFVGGGFSLNQ
ncbi:hypothetical protein BBJ29_002772 [Phytophthora kernoviae]|uniref:Cilia- and flagella-associated protein 58 central coiled coil domain-containing protein n=1 Tax=Phytophthora kernoviae TaxID=325452 RepID=A0A3F2S4A5_9STRA|nr:hypothetical protein BBJ29_002772 [Phytophthora kernoviae]RLN69966.1 hypothetical protein BBP00_00000054 [Phytophthora kernoviae]